MDPKQELLINEKLKDERKESDDKYAPIIVKTIVYSAVGMVCAAFITYLTAKIWPR